MKKLIALLLALVMVLALAACGAKTEEPAAEEPAAEAPAEEPAETPAEEPAARYCALPPDRRVDSNARRCVRKRDLAENDGKQALRRAFLCGRGDRRGRIYGRLQSSDSLFYGNGRRQSGSVPITPEIHGVFAGKFSLSKK